ncbi:hypothetical protein JCM19992_09270 [Thermostilla marina]
MRCSLFGLPAAEYASVSLYAVETIAAADTPLAGLPSPVTAFPWHGDMFTLPPDARLLARSEACPHQAFLYGNRVLGLQFHLEYDVPTIRAMLHHYADELVPGPRPFIGHVPGPLLPGFLQYTKTAPPTMMGSLHKKPPA